MATRRKSYRHNPFSITAGGVGAGVIVLAAGVAAFVIWRWLKGHPGALNPASTNNVVYGGANSAVRAVTGDANATVGTKIADWFKPAAEKQVDTMLKTMPKARAASRNETPVTFGTPAQNVMFAPLPDATPMSDVGDSDGIDDVIADNVTRIRR